MRQLACLTLLLTTATAAWAESFKLSLADTQAAAAATFDVVIRVADAGEIGAMQFDLHYDPAVLRVAKAVPGDLLKKAGAALESNDGEPGKLRLGWASSKGVSGDGELIKLRFVAGVKAGAKSPLEFKDVRAWQSKTSLELLADAQHGSVTLTAPSLFQNPLLLWIGGGVVGLLVIVVVARRLNSRRNS